MITTAERSILVSAVSILRRNGSTKLAAEVRALIDEMINIKQQILHQEGATKVLPPIQGSPNQGCNASRYPYN